MKKRKLFILFLIPFILSSCDPVIDDDLPSDGRLIVNFILNYRHQETTLPSGNEALGDDLLYKQVKLEKDSLLEEPDDPFRYGYQFAGWFKEKAGLNEWDFESDLVVSNLFLYAKWQFEHDNEYVEPDYILEERIDETMEESIILEGVCNIPIESGLVNLTKAAIMRLENKSDNCLEYLNYVRKSETEIIHATYNPQTKTISLKTKYEGVESDISILVVDVTSSYAVSGAYETKAQAYEANSLSTPDHRVMLGGSSSMENWETSTEDMMPIISYNYGIGGTVIEHWLNGLARRLIYPFSPKAVVLYVGINNIISWHSGGELTGDLLIDLVDDIHFHLPNTKIFYVLMNLTPNFLQYTDDIHRGNQKVIDYANKDDNSTWLKTIDAGTILLKPNGVPHAAYFLSDGLHMSVYGYVLWGGEVKKALMANL